MISRIWACTEQPLLLRALALPLSPVFLLVLLSVVAVLIQTRRRELASLGLRVIGGALAVLVALIAIFLALALSLRSVGLDPDLVLRFAPIGWGVGGCLIWGASGAYAWRVGGPDLRAKLRAKSNAPRKVWLWSGIGLASSFLVAVIVGRSLVSNAWLVSIPYRLLEYAVIDEIDLAVSNECLTLRVLEYGDHDRIGRDAQDELERRDLSAVDGVAAKLDDVADHWPPPWRTLTTSGIASSLRFIKRRGETRVLERWRSIDFQKDLNGAQAASAMGAGIGPVR